MPRSAQKERRGQTMPLRPVLAFLAIWLGGSSLIVGALLHPLLPGGWTAVGIFIAATLIPIAAILSAFGGFYYPTRAVRLIVFRPFWYAMLIMPLLAIATVIGVTAGFATGDNRLAGYRVVAVVAIAIVFGAIAGFIGSKRLVVRHLSVRLPNLPEEFDGVRIVQISDMHVGPHTPRRYLARVASAIRDARPDLIVTTGDQVDDFARDTAHFASAFNGLNAPLGVFAIAGNHDVYAGWDGVSHALSAMGMTVLVNEAIAVERGGARIWIAGTGDPAGQMWHRAGGMKAAPDVERTLSGVPDGEPVVVLAHNPDQWPELVRRGADLTLSGHTHYGQLAIPRLGWNLASPFVHPSMGMHRDGSSLLYINPGTNYWGLPFRIGTPPEVTVIVLSRSSAGDPPCIEVSPRE